VLRLRTLAPDSYHQFLVPDSLAVLAVPAGKQYEMPGPFSLEIQNDPYPYDRWLRENHPVYHDAENGYWVISRYADVVAAARNHADFSSAHGIGPAKLKGMAMVSTDPPDHTRLRALVTRAFQPGVIEALAPGIEKTCHRLIDASAAARGSFDLMEDFAFPLPIIVIAELLGLDPARYEDYKRWTRSLVASLANPDSSVAQREYAHCVREFFACLYSIGQDRLRSPRKDLISLLIQARVERDALTPIEIGYACELFLAAGTETTSSLIGNAALTLAAHPEQAALVLENPGLMPSLIEEAIRYDGPFRGDFRTTTRALSLHGIEIPKGAKVALLLASANRDSQVFSEPDRFLVTRHPNPHLGFGHGIHYCLGAPLARLEARVAAQVLQQRFRYLAPNPDKPPVRDYTVPMLRQLRSLPMTFILRESSTIVLPDYC
jgi:cytochrome P450